MNISKKRISRLAEKYGPFVRFFPGGSEEADTENDGQEPDESKSGVTDDEAKKDVLNEAEGFKVEDTPQFKGILRDRQMDRQTLAQVNAELATTKAEYQKLMQQIEQAKNADKPQYTEEELEEAVLRKDLLKQQAENNKNLIAEFDKRLEEREIKNRLNNLKRQQAADAKVLLKTATSKTKGIGLEAKTVIDEAAAYLMQNDPDYYKFLSQRPDFASALYKLATGEPLVPSIGQKVTIRRNALLTEKFNQKGDDVPGGEGPSKNEISAFEAIMSAGEEMPDDDLAKFF